MPKNANAKIKIYKKLNKKINIFSNTYIIYTFSYNDCIFILHNTPQILLMITK